MLFDGVLSATTSAQRLATTNLEDFKKNLMLIESRLNTSGSYFTNAVLGLSIESVLTPLLEKHSYHIRSEQSYWRFKPRGHLDILRPGTTNSMISFLWFPLVKRARLTLLTLLTSLLKAQLILQLMCHLATLFLALSCALFDQYLVPPEETPQRTPPWLILLRILLAALIVLGFARGALGS